jgi:hypothetical protein
LISIDKFVSIDPVTRAETDISDDQFSLADELSRWPRILPQNGANWSQGIFKVEFTAGYSDVDVIPRKFKQAILLHAEAHYDRDPAMMDKLVAAACNLIDRERGDLGIG